MKIKNIEAVAERIKKAVHENERIIIYGDSDLDGIASVTILEEGIRQLGGMVNLICFPNRENDGYGINKKALDFLKDKAPALLITLDLGIGNVSEIDIANSLGFEVVVVDHHMPLSELPRASIIMDPLQPGDEFPFKSMANAGLTYHLVLELLGDISEELKNNLLELSALATISDMVPQVEQNKEIIDAGLTSLKNTKRVGLQALTVAIKKQKSANTAIAQMISALNVAESENFTNKSYTLLTSASRQECEMIVEELLGKYLYKQEQIKNIVQEVDRRLMKKDSEAIIFEGDPAWRLMFAGSAASTLVRKYEKPIFLFKKMDTESTGSVRSIVGINSVDAMKSCADLLITYGGHAMASGFRLKNENLEEFKRRLIEYIQQ